MHTFGKINAVEYPDLIALPLQKSAALVQGAALGVYHHIAAPVLARTGLKKLGGEPEAGLAGARRADDAGVEVAGIGRVLGPGVHGEKFRPGENDVVLKYGIDERGDVFGTAP